MIVVELAFDGNPARLELRPAHREKLKQLHQDNRLVSAGPFDDDSGALLLFAVDSREEAREILADDPYYAAPGVTVLSIRRWTPVVG